MAHNAYDVRVSVKNCNFGHQEFTMLPTSISPQCESCLLPHLPNWTKEIDRQDLALHRVPGVSSTPVRICFFFQRRDSIAKYFHRCASILSRMPNF